MVLYLDTSALVKLFLKGDVDRAVALDGLAVASSAATSVIAYTECRAAFARRQRSGDLEHAQLDMLVEQLDAMWPRVRNRQVSDELAHLGGFLAAEHALRGYDAVHLATAILFSEEFGDLEFLSFDHRLKEAARSAALRVYGDPADATS